MSATPPTRRLRDRFAGTPSFLGENTQLTGDIIAGGPFVACGSIVGDGRIDGALNIATAASWEGRIACREAVVTGRIVGSITVEGKLEIGRSAHIRGGVSAGSIAIAQGAVVEGEITVTGTAPIHRFEEKRE